MRRAQAALEFLTTYGWAFIVILVMIGALAYFGVLSPSKVLPAKCIVEAGWDCKDYVIHEGDFSINLVNKKGEAMKNVGIINITSDSDQVPITLATCSITPVNVPADDAFVISCTPPAVGGVTVFQGLVGQKVKIDFIINYTMSRGTYAQTFSGSIYATVQT
jgi:hypothetical protein